VKSIIWRSEVASGKTKIPTTFPHSRNVATSETHVLLVAREKEVGKPTKSCSTSSIDVYK
jgi:hypothetical protein